MNSFALRSLLLLALPAGAHVTLPWHQPAAPQRIVYRIESPLTLLQPTVWIPAGDAAPLLVDAAAPDRPLAAASDGPCLAVRLDGTLTAGKPRYLAAYLGGPEASPQADRPPVFTCDFASTVLGRAWDFEDGTAHAVSHWGNSPKHLGAITVKEGWLQVPVKDTDPYVIFGDMFGPAGSPRALHIDSSVYRFLELRVRQSCPSAEWSFYVTDHKGRYQSKAFIVKGTDAQTFRFDLKKTFPDFWDSREFRALRLDTTNNKKDVLAEVDYVRLLPAPPTVTAGPRFSRNAVAARDRLNAFTPAVPRTVTAGEVTQVAVKTRDTAPEVPLLWSFATPALGKATLKGSATTLTLPAFTQAGPCSWTLGPADDLGDPLHAVAGTLDVLPAALTGYRLTPSHAFVDARARQVPLTVEGLDRFGNTLPADIPAPRWQAGQGILLPQGRLSGNPATVTLTLPADTAATTHRIALSDAEGRQGAAEVTSVVYRKDAVRLNDAGYLVTPAGTLVVPCGGFYANWPHRLTPDGSCTRAVDLFPCNDLPYKEGFPWTPETEAAVAAYLKHCADRNVNCLRLMLRNMDLVGRVDPVQLQATRHLFDLARPYGIRFNVALMEDYDKPPYVSRAILEKIVLPHYTPEQLADLPPYRARFLIRRDLLPSAAARYSDADAIACQRDYLRALIPVLAAREEVLCYEFENEMVYPPMAWCRDTAAFIRTIDPHTLILGNPGPHDWPEPLRWRDSGADLFSFHPYNNGQPDVDHGAIIFLRSKFAAQSRLPFYTGEGGINQGRWQKGVKQVAGDAAARGARDQIWMSVCCGANGCLYWTLMHDLEAQEFAKIQPALDALGLDLKRLKRQRPNVALVLPPERRDSRDAPLTMRLLDLGVDFDTVTANEAAAYPVRIDVETQKPETLDLPAAVARPDKGWQLATLLSAPRGQAFLYLRNVAGGVKDFGAPPRSCYLRDVQQAEAGLTLNGIWRTARVFDLDTRQSRTVTPDAKGRITLGLTSHDFLIALQN